MILSVFSSCGGSEEITTEKSSEKIEKTTENVEITTEKIEKTSESESNVMTEATEVTTAPIEIDDWYVKEGSVQIEFELGEKFNYNDIVVIHEVNGEVTEYPEDDIYVEHEPDLTFPGKYVVSVEVLPEEIIMTYTITVKDVDVAKVFEKAPTLSLGEEKSVKLEIEDIDLSHINSNGKLIVDDEYASGKKYVQNYGKIGNCFGFKISSDKNIEGAKIVLRMANFAVTMIYPAENIALYQNYVSIEENTRLEFDPNYYLTTRAPSMDGQSGADTSLVWCEVVLENITLHEGENSFMLAVIGKEAPFLDCIEIIVP
jgi:hypothetical protein